MDAEVYWEDRLIGRLSNIVIDQPYYQGAWTPTGDQEFERAYLALQARVAPDGLGMIPVTFRSPDGTVTAPAAAMVRANAAEPYFRFGGGGSAPEVVHEPRRN
jgi:hypothetical protein